MKKRLIPILAVLASVSLSAFAGCTQHAHDYEWKNEDGKHWQECSCGDKTEPEAHVDEKNNETGAAGADELCDVCGANLHVHAYAWTSDDAEHWKTCVCGDVDSATAKAKHVDEKNNETGAAGADELCDVCAKSVFPVVFDMKGIGTAPATQYIGKDGHAVAPATPADEDADKFKGWYTDNECTTAYDFATATVSAPTTVYAKWEEDTTEGASKRYAYELELAGNPHKAQKDKVVYYAFTAENSGRYKLMLGTGVNNENATFTTSKTGDTKYGKGALEAVIVDVDKDETVHIMFTFLGEEGDDVLVGPVVNVVEDEELPADRYPTGTYVSADGSVRAEFTHADKYLVSDLGEITVKYLGGKYDMLYFTADIQGNIGAVKYVDGKYLLEMPGADPVELLIQPAVALSAITGYYEPASYTSGDTTPDTPDGPGAKPDAGHGSASQGASGITGGIAELYIYQSNDATATSVRYKMLNKDGGASYSDLVDAEYDEALNKLTFGQFDATVNLDANGAVESINLVIGTDSGVVSNKYLYKVAAPAIPPESIDMELNDGNYFPEYNGDEYNIITYYGGVKYLDQIGQKITVLSYDEAARKYKVVVNSLDGDTFTTYYLVVSVDKKTIELYDKDDTTKLDTLTRFEWHYHDLPTTTGDLNVPANGLQKNYYVYTVKQTGWYQLTLPSGVAAYTSDSMSETINDYKPLASGKAIYLTEDYVLAIYVESSDNDVIVGFANADAPVGTTENNPIATSNGTVTAEVAAGIKYYFKHTAPKAGAYVLTANYYYSEKTSFDYVYVNGEYVEIDWQKKYAIIEVDDSLTVTIAVDCNVAWDTVTVAISDDYSSNATELKLTGTGFGDTLTATATAETGANYYIANTKNEPVTVTCNAPFTIKIMGGGEIEAVEDDGTYTAEIPSGTGIYFRLEADTTQELMFSQTFEHGTAGYPNEVVITEGEGTYTLSAISEDDGYEPKTAFIGVAPGTYEITAPMQTVSGLFGPDAAMLHLYINYVDEWSSYPEIRIDDDDYYIWVITVEEGDVLYVSNVECDDDIVFTFKVKGDNVFTEDQVGTYVGTDGMGYETNLKIEANGKGVYKFGIEMDVIITAEDEGYSFTYDAGFNQFVTVTFTISGNTISILNPEDGDEPVVLTKQVQVGSQDNPYEVTFDDGTATVVVPAEEEYYIQLSAGNYNIANDGLIEFVIIEHSDGGYDYVDFNPTDATISLTVSAGDLVVISHMFGDTITITEVAD